MGALAMLAERLAMIGDDDDGCPGEEIEALQATEESPERRVGVRHFAVVRRGWMRRGERGGRRIGRMRVEQVCPDEERLRAVLVDPGERGINHRVRRSFNRSSRFSQKLIVVPVEPTRESERPLERIPADERRRRISTGPHRLCDRPYIGGRAKAVVGPDPMTRWIQTGEHRRVCRKRKRHLRDCRRKARRVLRKPIERWRQPASRTVRADPIRAERIDGDKEDRTAD